MPFDLLVDQSWQQHLKHSDNRKIILGGYVAADLPILQKLLRDTKSSIQVQPSPVNVMVYMI